MTRKELINHLLNYKIEGDTHIVVDNGKSTKLKLYKIEQFAGEGHIYINLKDKRMVKK